MERANAMPQGGVDHFRTWQQGHDGRLYLLADPSNRHQELKDHD
jgi:hypothetical protein